MLANKWQKKADKYKTKYLALKKQLGGLDLEFMTSRIDPIKYKDFYLSQKLFNYWISSSHNTYLPYDQNTDITSVCYYRLQYMVYTGGCVEIDTYGVKDNNVIISHMWSNKGEPIKLEDILDIIMKALITKINKGIISGPFILNFDNSSPSNSLKTKAEQEIFWKNINNKLLMGNNLDEYIKVCKEKKVDPGKNPVLFIDENFDLSNIKIKDMSHKILFRWGLNTIKNCNSDNVGHNLCRYEPIINKFSKNPRQWIHIDKGDLGFTQKFVEIRNMSQSKPSPPKSGLTDINIFSIVNAQRNLLRFFPHALNVFSGNYDNMKYFRDGVQITAINLQKIGSSRLLNDAVFIPSTSKFCSPHDIENNKCLHGLDQGSALSYRLKPLWLIGLVPYPQLYDLVIKKVDCKDSSNIEFIYGLNKEKYSGKTVPIRIPNIDVTVPFFIVNDSKKNIIGIKSDEYTNGIDIVWNQSNLSNNTMTFNIYQFIVEEPGIVIKNEYNRVDAKNELDDCQQARLLNYKNYKTVNIEYTWVPSKSEENIKHMELIQEYNKIIEKTKINVGYTTLELLQDIDKLNCYQNKLFYAMLPISTKIKKPEPEEPEESEESSENK
jgi:hypothetical protein